MKNLIILGGDGYLGWPTAMFFSKKGYNVTVVDNLFRRKICASKNVGLLYKPPTLINRAKIWYKKTGLEIKVIIKDLRNPENMFSLFDRNCKYNWSINSAYSGLPHTIIHYAEQPSAPYSMKDIESANFTILNNVNVTNNLLFAVKKFSKKTHIIKLGTMGEYGTPNIDIEEGWLNVVKKGRKQKFLFPRQASSIYHTSKIMDTDLIWFAVRTWGLRVTDLMQGPVYGLLTDEMQKDERLMSIFNYDEIFGTVINRFITQAVAGHPLTIYGKGGQTRGYLNIKDTLQCVYYSARYPAKKNELRIFNQIVETFSVKELAERISKVANKIGYSSKIKQIKNPRVELEKHYYNPKYQGLKKLGVKTTPLTDKIIQEMIELVAKYKNNINQEVFFKKIKW